MNDSTTSPLVDILKGVVGSAALFFAYLQLPIIGMAAGVFAAFPAIYFGLKRSRSSAVIIVVLTALIFIPFPKGINIALFFLIQSGVLAAALTWFLASGRSGAQSLLYTVSINLLLAVTVTVVFGVLQGSDPHTFIIKEIESSISQTLPLFEKSGITGDDLQMLRESMLQAKALLVEIYPALVIIWVALVAGLNLLLVSLIAPRLPVSLNLQRFATFRNPEPLVWILITAGFGTLIPEPLVGQVALNVLIVVCAGYFVQGLAVFSAILDRFNLPLLLRNVLYLFMVLQPYLLLGVVVLGIFDIWGDFRTPKLPKKPVE